MSNMCVEEQNPGHLSCSQRCHDPWRSHDVRQLPERECKAAVEMPAGASVDSAPGSSQESWDLVPNVHKQGAEIRIGSCATSWLFSSWEVFVKRVHYKPGTFDLGVQSWPYVGSPIIKSAGHWVTRLVPERGGGCLLKQYRGWLQRQVVSSCLWSTRTGPLLWRCGSGHTWRSTVRKVKSIRVWCPHCKDTGRRREEDVRRVFEPWLHHCLCLSECLLPAGLR